MSKPQSIQIAETTFQLQFAIKATLHLHGKSGADIAEPETIPKLRVEMETIKITPGDGLKRGRKIHRSAYYQPDSDAFTKTPNGKKEVDDITNARQVKEWIKDSVANLGNGG